MLKPRIKSSLRHKTEFNWKKVYKSRLSICIYIGYPRFQSAKALVSIIRHYWKISIGGKFIWNSSKSSLPGDDTRQLWNVRYKLFCNALFPSHSTWLHACSAHKKVVLSHYCFFFAIYFLDLGAGHCLFRQLPRNDCHRFVFTVIAAHMYLYFDGSNVKREFNIMIREDYCIDNITVFSGLSLWLEITWPQEQ